MNKVLLASFAVTTISLLYGCASDRGMNNDRGMNKYLSHLVGQDIHVAIDKLGVPASASPLGNEKVYTFVKNDCSIRVTTDASEQITRSDYDGDRRDCQKYYDALDD
jgi:hypothetical protein